MRKAVSARIGQGCWTAAFRLNSVRWDARPPEGALEHVDERHTAQQRQSLRIWLPDHGLRPWLRLRPEYVAACRSRIRADFRVILFDHVGAGQSDLTAYDPSKYAELNGYAEDVIEIGQELGVQHGVFIGHSVSAMIGVLAWRKQPQMFDDLVLVGPSPRYIDDGEYLRLLGGAGA